MHTCTHTYTHVHMHTHRPTQAQPMTVPSDVDSEHSTASQTDSNTTDNFHTPFIMHGRGGPPRKSAQQRGTLGDCQENMGHFNRCTWGQGPSCVGLGCSFNLPDSFCVARNGSLSPSSWYPRFIEKVQKQEVDYATGSWHWVCLVSRPLSCLPRSPVY